MTIRGKAYGEMLVAARRAAGLTQADVAKRVGVVQSTYSKWEKGDADLQGIHIRPLAKALGLPIEDVVPPSTSSHEFEDPSERIGMLLIQRVAAAVSDGRLGPRQARVLLDLLEELAPDDRAPG